MLNFNSVTKFSAMIQRGLSIRTEIILRTKTNHSIVLSLSLYNID
jgi:hypothetical protein